VAAPAAPAGVEAPSALPAQRASALGAFFSGERQAGAVAQAGAQPAPAHPVAPAAAPVAPAAPVASYPAQPAAAPAAGQDGGLPSRRVRGAQLPDLGDSEETAAPRRDPSSIGRQLSGLQASTARARHEAAAAGQPGDHDTLGS
jgi:hypothetical protein